MVDRVIPPLSVAIVVPHEEIELLIDEVRVKNNVGLVELHAEVVTLIVEHGEDEPLLDIPFDIVLKISDAVGNEVIEHVSVLNGVYVAELDEDDDTVYTALKLNVDVGVPYILLLTLAARDPLVESLTKLE